MEDHTLNLLFSALSDPTRRKILTHLRDGEATVTELLEPLDISQPALSKHLKVLWQAGLVTVSTDAQRRPRRLEATPLEDAARWLETFRPCWEESAQRRAEFGNLLSADESIDWD